MVPYIEALTLHCQQDSSITPKVTPWHVVNGGVCLWKKSVMCDFFHRPIQGLIPYSSEVWLSLGQSDMNQCSLLSIKGCVFTKSVPKWSLMYFSLLLTSPSCNLQRLLALGMQNAHISLITSWWLETLNCPITWLGLWGKSNIHVPWMILESSRLIYGPRSCLNISFLSLIRIRIRITIFYHP